MANYKETANTLLGVASVAANVLSEEHEGSLFQFTAVANNNIITTVEDTLTHHEVTADILKLTINLFAGHYMQSVALLSQINGVEVRQTLDRLNSNRSPIGAASDWVAVESRIDYPNFHSDRPSLEGVWDDLEEKFNNKKVEGVDAYANQPRQENGKWAAEIPSLVTGKLFDVRIEGSNGKAAVIPVRFSVSPISCSRSLFTSLYADGNKNNTWLTRIKRWTDGELSSIGDMIMVNDIIAERAKLLKADTQGIRKELEKRRAKNKLSTIITQKTSLATASGVTIMTKQTASDVELANGSRLKDYKSRSDIFNRSGLAMMVIVDQMYETVQFYFRGQAHGMELTFKECKTATKGSGPNVLEVLKAFQAGHVPNV